MSQLNKSKKTQTQTTQTPHKHPSYKSKHPFKHL